MDAKPEVDGGPGPLRNHPVIVGIFAICIGVGMALGAWLLTDEWTLLRRLAAGAFGGAGCAWLMTVTRLLR